MAKSSLSKKAKKQGAQLAKMLISFVGSKTFFVLAIAWFFIQAVYIAFSTETGIPPDENYHIALINFFSDSGWTPYIQSQEGFFKLGEVINNPFTIYHYLLSIPNSIFGGDLSVFALRFMNILMAVGSLFVVDQIGKVLKLSKIARNLSVFMIANTLMFTFLAASVNYDNLFILVFLISLLQLLKLWNKIQLNDVLTLILAVLVGSLTKESFLAVAVSVGALLFFRHVRDTPKILKKLSRQKRNFATYVLAVFCVIIGFYAVSKYVPNAVNYGTYIPSCQEVNSLDECLANPIIARDQGFAEAGSPEPVLSVYQYVSNWFSLMVDRTYGVFGHQSFASLPIIYYGVLAIGAVGTIGFIRYIDKKRAFAFTALGVVAFYTVLLINQNMNAYESTGISSISVQGRYVLPVLALLYLLWTQFSLRMLRTKIRGAIYIVLILSLFSISGVYTYIVSTDPTWHPDRADGINESLRSRLPDRE